MKAYTLSILAKLAGKDEMSGQNEGDDIVNWANNKVKVLHDAVYYVNESMTFEGKILMLLFEGNIGLLLFVCSFYLFIYLPYYIRGGPGLNPVTESPHNVRNKFPN